MDKVTCPQCNEEVPLNEINHGHNCKVRSWDVSEYRTWTIDNGKALGDGVRIAILGPRTDGDVKVIEIKALQDCQEKLHLTEMREIGFLEAFKISEEKLEAERKLSDYLAGEIAFAAKYLESIAKKQVEGDPELQILECFTKALKAYRESRKI